MTQLTDTQLILLSTASRHEKGAVAPPAQLRGAAVTALSARLIREGLMREEPAAFETPVWRRAEDGSPIALLITASGLEAIGVQAPTDDEVAAQEVEQEVSLLPARNHPEPATMGSDDTDSAGKEDAVQTIPAERAGTKQAMVVDMLVRPEGATITELVAATGWLPHTTRAALTGLRKKGHVVERAWGANGLTRYRIKGNLSSPETSTAAMTSAEEARVPPLGEMIGTDEIGVAIVETLRVDADEAA